MADLTPEQLQEQEDQRQQAAKQHKEHLSALAGAISLVEDDPDQLEKYKQLATQYYQLLERTPATRLQINLTITVPTGMEERGRHELHEILANSDLDALITQTAGDPQQIDDHLLEDYEEDLEYPE